MDHESMPAASSRIIWLVGEGTSLGFAVFALYTANLPLPSVDLPYREILFLGFVIAHYLCLAHLLWVGYGVRLAAVLAAAHALIFLSWVFSAAILLDSVKLAGIEYNAYVLCRLCFGIALIGTWRKLPSHVGVYGIAPILIALITLFIRQDHFAPMLGHFYIGMIELCGSLYLAGLFLWNVGWGKRPAMEQKDDIPGSPARAIFSP